MPPLLEVRNLKVQFKTQDGVVAAVNDVSFHLDRGETLGIVGESGSGKSVTSLALMRLIPTPPGQIAAGTILFDGENLLEPRGPEARDRTVGYGRYTQRCPRLDDYPHQFSGGMRQRVMIAMGLSCNPELLIADEPTTALDVTIQAQILELINRLKNETDTAVIIITHDLGVVAGMADRVVVMYAGRIVEEGATSEIFANPRMPYTIGLLRSIPRLDEQEGRKLTPIRGLPPDLINLPPVCPFSPRCDYFVAGKCDQTVPPLRPVGADHRAACLFDITLDTPIPEQERVGEVAAIA